MRTNPQIARFCRRQALRWPAHRRTVGATIEMRLLHRDLDVVVTMPTVDAMASSLHALTATGVAIWDNALSDVVAAQIRAEVLALKAADSFRPACVGRGVARRRIPEVRGDFVCWLSPGEGDNAPSHVDTPGLKAFCELLESLRVSLARLSFTRLDEVELFASHYPPHTYYRAHVDRFTGSTVRHFTFVYYLNDAWEPAHGGALSIKRPVRRRIRPLFGRLVLFHTPDVLHEVSETHADRFALTGWFGERRVEFG